MDNLWLIYGYGWWFEPLKNIRMIVPNLWKNENYSKFQWLSFNPSEKYESIGMMKFPIEK